MENTNTNIENTEIETPNNEQTTYSLEEVQKLIQSETDKRVSQALKTQQKKYEKQQTEAEKLRNMTDEQKQSYEYEQKLQTLEAREKEFNLMQNKLECTKILSEKGLPTSFVDYVVTDDAETMNERINDFEKLFKAEVQDAVTKKIGSTTPKTSTSSQVGLTKESFKNLSLNERMNIAKTNPTLYNSLTN